MKYIVAQLGARRHYAVPRILHEAGLLERLYTDVCGVKGWPRALRAVPPSLRPASLKRLLSRVPHGIPGDKITAFSMFGLLFERRRKRARTRAQSTSSHLWAADRFCEKVIASGGLNSSGVYTFNGAGLDLLKRAGDHGLHRIMEQTIAPMEVECRLLEREQIKFPEWQGTHDNALHLSAWIDRERQEWAASEIIICGSEFVRAAIAECGGPVERCLVVPYGVGSQFQVPVRPAHNGPLRILTVGAIGLRKGSPYVLAAARRMGTSAQFRMCGSFQAPLAAIRELAKHVDVIGPVPRSEIRTHFQWADVFLLPAICEGSATVTYEALTAGLPVICTPNTGSIIRDGVNGFIVPPGDVDAIVFALQRFTSSRAALPDLMRNVRQTAQEASLEAYASRLITAVCHPAN